MRSRTAWGAAVLAAALGAGCASPPAAPVHAPQGARQGVEYGVVQDIETVAARQQTSGAGAVVGGALGGLVGRQIGSGGGRDAATAVGVLAGAIMGNEIEKNRRGAADIYRVTVRVDGGGLRSFDYATLDDLRVGDRVRIDNNQLYRW